MVLDHNADDKHSRIADKQHLNSQKRKMSQNMPQETQEKLVGAPRFHHQWYPDRLRMEKGFDESVVTALKKMGHEIEPRIGVGVTQNVMRIGDTLYGASDPRSSSSLAAGY